MMENIKPIGSTFNFECARCKQSNLKFSPIGVSYKPLNNYDNDDIKNKRIRKHFNQLKYIHETIKNCDGNDKRIMVECLDCGNVDVVYEKIDNVKLQKYMRKYYGKMHINMRLGSEND